MRIASRERSIEIPVYETPTACAGAAASHVLRRISYRAGAYAPGIQDAIFDELHETRFGATIAETWRWFAQRCDALHALAYRIEARACEQDTRALIEWVRSGRGYRGAIVATDYQLLHPETRVGNAIVHAVGLAVEGCEAGGEGTLVMIDPWSSAARGRCDVSAALEPARLAKGNAGLALHWTGWK